jgi:uncharacterized membrane protein
MSTAVQNIHVNHVEAPRYGIRRVGVAAPLDWVRKGFEDFGRMPLLSLVYGLLFTALVIGVYLATSGAPWYALAYFTGLLVVAPFLAAGLYVARRDLDAGREPFIESGLVLVARRKTYLALFSTVLALVMAAWVRFSALLFAVKFTTVSPSIDAYTTLLTSTDGLITLGYFVGSGVLLAAVVFVLSAVAVPLILDRNTDFITAMQTSYRATMANLPAMTLWALAIVALMTLGLFAFFVGLAVVFPVLGYATWHAYRAVVESS